MYVSIAQSRVNNLGVFPKVIKGDFFCLNTFHCDRPVAMKQLNR